MKLLLLFVGCFLGMAANAQMATSAPASTKHGTMTVRKPSVVVEIISEEERVIFKVVEQMPVYPGGQNAMQQNFNNVPYPNDMVAKGLTGMVVIQFVIDSNGNVIDPIIVGASVPQSGQDAALKHLEAMPRWQPGRQRGKPVDVMMAVRIYFRTP